MGRRLHLIDIENLACDAFDAHGIAHQQLRRYLDAVWRPGDFMTIASNRWLWSRLAWDVAVAHRYIVPPSGQDSADKALLASAECLDLSTFESIVIGSGDHIFTDLAIAAADQGVKVWVAAARGTIAHSLRQAAHSVHELPPAAQLVSQSGNGSAPGRSPAVKQLPRRRQYAFNQQPPQRPHRPWRPRPEIPATVPAPQTTVAHAANTRWPHLARPDLAVHPQSR